MIHTYRFLNQNGANVRMIMVGKYVSDVVRGTIRLAEMAATENKVSYVFKKTSVDNLLNYFADTNRESRRNNDIDKRREWR